MPTTFYTKEEYKAVESDSRCYMSLIRSVLRSYSDADDKSRYRNVDKGRVSKLEKARYPFIALPIRELMERLNVAYKLATKKYSYQRPHS